MPASPGLTPERTTRLIAISVAIWLSLAVTFVALGGMRRLPPPMIIWPLTLGALAVVWFARPVRQWAAEADLRVMIGFHLVRFVGIYFLVLNAQGRLDSRFAIPAGIGDIIAALGAGALLAWGSPATRSWRRWCIAWNLFGLADILMVIGSATRLYLTDTAAVEPFRRLPLGVLPSFVVPLVIATHVIMLARLLRRSEAAAAP